MFVMPRAKRADICKLSNNLLARVARCLLYREQRERIFQTFEQLACKGLDYFVFVKEGSYLISHVIHFLDAVFEEIVMHYISDRKAEKDKS